MRTRSTTNSCVSPSLGLFGVNNLRPEIRYCVLYVHISTSCTDPDIRYCVLLSLDERFDPHLAQAENLSALFVALNDEVFEIRELAICTVGRLSSMNPAYVMPSLRKTLIQVGLPGVIKQYEPWPSFMEHT